MAKRVFNIMLSRDLGGIQQAYLDYNEALEEAGFVLFNISSSRAQINKFLPGSIKLPTLTPWCLISKIYLWILAMIYKPDIIISHGGKAINFAAAIKPKSVKLFGVAHNYSFKRLKKCDYVIVITEHLGQYMIDNGYDKNSIFQIPNMLRIKKEYAEHKFHSPIVIGSYGRFVQQKGYEYLIEAIALLKKQGYNIKLILGGNGEDETKLKTQVKELGIQDITKFYGWVDDKDEFFKQIDIFCLPSIHEPFGIVLLEAMEQCKPIVSTKCEGPVEILKHEENAQLAEIGSASDIALKLSNFINNPNDSYRCAKASYIKLRSHYDIKVVSKKISDFLQTV